jgi:hypothetical protein
MYRIFYFHDYAGLLPKNWINSSKRDFLLWNSGSQRKERFLHRITVKKLCLHYVLLCSTMNLLCIIYAFHRVHIVYYETIFPNCIMLTALFPSFSFLLTLFLGFLYLYIVVFLLSITMMLWLCLSVQGCVFFRFFDVETSF